MTAGLTLRSGGAQPRTTIVSVCLCSNALWLPATAAICRNPSCRKSSSSCNSVTAQGIRSAGGVYGEYLPHGEGPAGDDVLAVQRLGLGQRAGGRIRAAHGDGAAPRIDHDDHLCPVAQPGGDL